MNKKKLKIAITGNIGSGKSVFTDFIKKYNYPVINADDLSKSILEKNPSVKKEVIKLFGNRAYKNDKPDRRYIADIVFNDQHKLSLLEKILHPVVIKETIELMDASLIMNDRVFVEAALIYEADMEKYFDLVILIVANKNLRFERKRKSEKFTEGEFEKREVMQIPEEEKRKRADFIFENNSDLKSLKQKAELLFILLNKPVTSNKQ